MNTELTVEGWMVHWKCMTTLAPRPLCLVQAGGLHTQEHLCLGSPFLGHYVSCIEFMDN
jgi:hypothetical protein